VTGPYNKTKRSMNLNLVVEYIGECNEMRTVDVNVKCNDVVLFEK
jgi:hypothetical protein